MSRPLGLVAGILLFAGTISAQTSPQYGQCGGIGWTGPTTCPSGWSCSYSNAWYSQCLPGTGGNPPPTTTANPPGTTTSVPGGTATLVPGYSFIRAVEDPNFHKYLQSETINTVGNAVLSDPSTAAQFQITNGQLVQNAGGTPLYAVVQSRTDPTLNKLQVSWSKTPATSGAFSWSGDTVLWSDPTVTRPQNNAFLVCPDSAGNKDLYINLGPYGYMTPAGCADETIHAYTGSTATA